MLTKHIRNLRNQKGFTLIELLVVVTLIAILAVAVLAAINPIEQRRKAQDTGAINLAAELMGAEERYFAQYGCYTWASTAAGVCTGTDSDNDLTTTSVSTTTLNLDFLEDVGEVKDGFENRVTALGNGTDYDMHIMADAGTAELHVALVPLSEANIAIADFTNACTGSAGTYFCVPDSQE